MFVTRSPCGLTKYNGINRKMTWKDRCAAIPGMSTVDNLAKLVDFGITHTVKGGSIVEIGVWCGRSSMALAEVAKEHNQIVHSYDIFDQDYWRKFPALAVFANEEQEDIARRNLAGVAHLVSLHKGTSALVDFPVSFAFIDGGHEYEEVSEDIRNLKKHLIEGAWIVLDDHTEEYPGVKRAAAENFTEVIQINKKMVAVR